MVPKHLLCVILYKFLSFPCSAVFILIALLSIGVKVELEHVTLWKSLLKCTLTIAVINAIDH